MRLANYCLEFGRVFSADFFEATKLILIDAFGLDSSSIIDAESGERLDSSIGLGTNWTGCTEVARRFGLLEYLKKEETILNELFEIDSKEQLFGDHELINVVYFKD